MNHYKYAALSFLTIALLTVTAVPVLPAPVNAASPSDGSPVRFEWYHAVQECTAIGYHAAQTFTPSTSHVVKQIKLKLWNKNIFQTGMITVGVAATDANGLPAGNFLASGTIASTLIGGYWSTVTIDLGSGCQVYARTRYAIRIDSPTGAIDVQVDTSGDSYARGSFFSSDRTMNYWVDHGNTYDIWFEEWGISSGTVPPEVVTNNASAIGTTAATLNGNLVSSGSAANVTIGFEFGPTTNYGKFVPSRLSGNGSFTADVSELVPNTLYHFRAVAGDDVSGTNYGAGQTFTTSSGRLARYQSYSANQDSTGIGYHAAQTFSTNTTHIARQIKLQLVNVNSRLTGNLTVGITAADANGVPAGNFLASGTLAGTSIGSSWTIVTIDLGRGCLVNAGTRYAIRIDSPDPDAVYARVDVSGAFYTGGNYFSADRDINYWIDHDKAYDIWFEEWGTPHEMVVLPQFGLPDYPLIIQDSP